jgi:hypothetical protein
LIDKSCNWCANQAKGALFGSVVCHRTYFKRIIALTKAIENNGKPELINIAKSEAKNHAI